MMLPSLLMILLAAQGQGKVGPINGSQSLLNTGQLLSPVGQMLQFKGRPVDMRVLPGHMLAVKDRGDLRIIDLASFQVKQSVSIPHGASPTGMAISADARKLYITSAGNEVVEFTRDEAGTWAKGREISLPGPKGPKDSSFPCGVALSADGNNAFVCLSRNNTLGIVDLSSGKLTAEVPTGIAPFEIALVGSKAYVTNQGGRRPSAGDMTSDSAGSEVVVDKFGLSATGTVTVIDLSQKKAIKEIPVGLQPCAIVGSPDGANLFVANANSDSISVIDAKSDNVVWNVIVKPNQSFPFGSMPDGLNFSKDGRRLYVALSGNNAVAVLELGRTGGTSATPSPSSPPNIVGFIPAGWYPVAVQEDDKELIILDNKGTGQRLSFRAPDKGMNSHDTTGGIQGLPLFALRTRRELMKMSVVVYDLRNGPTMLRAYERSKETSVAPVPVPKKLGEPSLIKHIVYVIKENRSYDQVFGDIGLGDSEPKLCVFGEKVTPNHHALAKQFLLLDNYYCNGVLSADGHSWATEGNVTPYLNRAFGGFNRSYTFGNDPITYSSSGFIWDGVLAAGLSFRNYGEMWSSDLPKGVSAKQLREGYRAGKTFDFPQTTGIDTIKRYSCAGFPGWNLDIPDQYRMDRFLKEFELDKATGQFPNFVLIYLPQDHTGGPLGPAADVADNDLAVGRLVDAVSHSSFWKDTAIFVNEDDPQAGFDHVDGHRSLCLVASPYTQTGSVVSEFYNQCCVLHTIQQIFGIAPLNQKVAASPLMGACFTEKGNLATYDARPAQIDLHELVRSHSARLAKWNRQVAKLDLRHGEVQGEKDMSILNHAIWEYMRPGERYPSKYSGAHGRGLAGKGLKLDSGFVDD